MKKLYLHLPRKKKHTSFLGKNKTKYILTYTLEYSLRSGGEAAGTIFFYFLLFLIIITYVLNSFQTIFIILSFLGSEQERNHVVLSEEFR
jgi:hypothetical protein